ncbi:MAG: MBL fold metallo-hydrolase [Puniceicoccales bacterium]|nr:MBL fold metallo-hydrolase [Puniceicoccales bacterium]
MSFNFYILGSSSSGNCALLSTPDANILIDAGFSARRIKRSLDMLNVEMASIDAVFLTHEHCDHCAGVAGLSRMENLLFFANRDTARAVQSTCTKTNPSWRIFDTGISFSFQGITVETFSIPHDAADPVGYTFTLADGATLSWVTDLGHVPRLVRERIKHTDYLVLESNYDVDMLACSARPLSLKQRIKGRHGHLSNDLALELLLTLESTRLKQVFLAHLSNECNTPALVTDAMATARAARPQCGFTVIAPDSTDPVVFTP